MTERPGASLARRPLNFFVVADCSGSMAADGKIQALNNALRETIPHVADLAAQNPHASVLFRVLAFSSGAWWHLEHPIEGLEWKELKPGGFTDLGAALTMLAGQLSTPPMEERAIPPVIVLVSDGMPTDDYEDGLQRLLAQPWGSRAVRVAVGIGRDADHNVLSEFMGDSTVGPLSASNPEQLTRMIRWASVHAGRVASTLASAEVVVPDDLEGPEDELVW